MTIQSEIQALKCADCARSDSAVSDLQPDSLLPFPADALSGLARRQARHAGRDAAQAAAQRRARLRRRVRRHAALLRGRLGVGGRAGGRADGQEHRRDLPQRRQRRAQLLRARRAPTEFATYQTLRPTIARALGPGTGAAVGTTIMPGTGSTLGFSNKLVSGTAGRPERRRLRLRHALRRRHGRRRAPISRSSRRPTTTRPTARTSRAATTGSPVRSRSCRPGWLGRWLDAYGSTSNPLQAVSLDSNLSKQIRSSKAPVCALEGLQGVGFSVPGRDRRRQQRGRQARRPCRSARATTRSAARAACGA